MDYIWKNPEPFSDEIWYVSEKRATYFGIVGKARFTYKLWKERIAAGVFLTGRYYSFELISMKRLNLGFSVGYRF